MKQSCQNSPYMFTHLFFTASGFFLCLGLAKSRSGQALKFGHSDVSALEFDEPADGGMLPEDSL